MQAVKLVFFILFIIFLANCSSRTKNLEEDKMTMGEKDYLEGIVSEISRKWFNTAQRFKLFDAQGSVAAHLFWDARPEINYKNKTLNFIVTTVAQSQKRYKIDISSGQRYFSQKFCKQNDVWKKYSDIIHLPMFTEGVVPRVLDQQMSPQKIIVFGNNEYYQKNYKTNYFDAKVIGSFVLQDCPKGACIEMGSWNSRMILVATQVGNERYKEIENINDLKKIIDWNAVVAFVENAYGRNKIAENLYPAFKVGSVVSPGQAMYFLEKKSKHFTPKDMKNLKISCYRLYDYLWKNLSFDARKLKEVGVEIKRFSKKTEKSSIKTELVTRPFFKRFMLDFKKYNNDFHTCSKYVYSNSANYNLDRFNFFTYLNAFTKVYKLGHYFNCDRKVWLENPVTNSGKRSVSLDEMFVNCKDRDIDLAFEKSVNYLVNLSKINRSSYSYIDYDRGVNGTHQKMYSWVKTSGKVLECNSDKELSAFKLNPSFPSDIKWKKREKKVKYDKKLGKIIK